MPHQVSVFAENKPGKLNRVTEILGKNNINIRAITISDTGDYGIIKLLLDKPAEGNEYLQNAGIASTLVSIVAIIIDDTPGSLHKATSILSSKNVNVEDAYGFTIRGEDRAVFVFQVKDVHATEKILKDAGFTIISDNELYYL
ncbi:MAG: ACT domain-containing protein [Spirochaetes bacterium]|nr:ACT domain-containing protein [Spirochaetota bacterium]